MKTFIDYANPANNMYGCAPCPKCGGKYRAPFRKDGKITVECDDCGFVEDVANPEVLE